MDSIVWNVDVEVLRHGEVEASNNDVTTTQVVLPDAVRLTVTPKQPQSVAHMQLLVVVKATRSSQLLFRSAFWVPASVHQEGPYDVFANHALVFMTTDGVHGEGESLYTRAFPRQWIGATFTFHHSQLMPSPR